MSSIRPLPKVASHTWLEAIAVFALWLIFSGKIVEDHEGHLSPDYVHLFFGVLSTWIVIALTKHLIVSRNFPEENQLFSRISWGRLLVYPFWLFKEVIKSNIDVAKVLLQPEIVVDPVIVRVPFPVKSSVALTVLANSITLTPGTFTLLAEDGVLYVHSIDRGIAEGLIGGDMQQRVATLFGEELPSGPAATLHQSIEEARQA